MGSSAARQRGEREASKNSNSIRLHRAQELLELLAAAGVDRRPLRAVVPDAAALDRLGDRRVGVDRLAQGPEADALLDGDRELRDGLASVPDRADVADAGFDGVRRRELQTVYLAQCFVSSLISLRSELSLEFQA